MLEKGLLAGDRAQLSRAITLIESRQAQDQALAQTLLQHLLPHTGRSRRIGITGVPGVGKSTFIEAFGCLLCENDLQVAVLTIDPSSQRSGGSILGDKTRMERLSREPKAFIRPSPAGETLGGVARKTREALLLCEAAGFDVTIVETVGVGQSETALRSMVDFFLLLMLPGAGDELQGIKRGIMELTDTVFINKADGDNIARAELAKGEYTMALHYMAPATREWTTPVMMGSALMGLGIKELWDVIDRFYATLEPKGVIAERRQDQSLAWLTDLLRDAVMRRFLEKPQVRERLQAVQQQLRAGSLTAPAAAEQILKEVL